MPSKLGSTFLTEGRSLDLTEPEAMTRVREEHTRLQGVVQSLNEKISQVLAKQEGDFLVAYRAHMYTVQKELQNLRQRVVEAENILQKNDKVQKLEDECDWYRKEALRLDGFNTAMKKDLKYMKDKVEAAEDGRNWLARQLKACKKQYNLLRAELRLRSEAAGKTDTVITVDPSQRSMMNIHSSRSQPILSGVIGTLGGIRGSSRAEDSWELLHPEKMWRLEKRRSPENKETGQNSTPTDALIKRIRGLERKLIEIQRAKARSRATRARKAVERTELEDFFFKCVEDIRQNIKRRKRQGQIICAHSITREIRARENYAQLPDGMNVVPPSVLPDMFQSAPTLEEFTASDRRAVVETLLQRDDVVAHLFDMFFPTMKPDERGVDHRNTTGLPSAMRPEDCDDEGSRLSTTE